MPATETSGAVAASSAAGHVRGVKRTKDGWIAKCVCAWFSETQPSAVAADSAYDRHHAYIAVRSKYTVPGVDGAFLESLPLGWRATCTCTWKSTVHPTWLSTMKAFRAHDVVHAPKRVRKKTPLNGPNSARVIGKSAPKRGKPAARRNRRSGLVDPEPPAPTVRRARRARTTPGVHNLRVTKPKVEANGWSCTCSCGWGAILSGQAAAEKRGLMHLQRAQSR